MIYSVIDKITQEEVYRYENDTAIEWPGMEFSTHAHVEVVVVVPDPPQVPVVVWTRLEFLRMFTQDERLGIRTLAKQNIALEDYLALLDNTTEVRSDDPDTIASLYMLEGAGLLATGRAQEILGV